MNLLRLSAIAVLIVGAAACGKAKKGKMSGGVGVANNVSSASALWEGEPLAAVTAGNVNERVSYNPTSLKMTLTFIQMCKSGNDGLDPNGNYGCADTRDSVKMTGSKEVELMNQTPFTDLAGFSTNNFDKKEFGNYVLAMIGYDGFATFSGAPSLDGATQTVTNAQVGSGSGITVKLPQTITVDDSHSPNLQIFFDVHAPAYIFNSLVGSSPPGSFKVGGTYFTGLSNWSLLAYLGSGTPTLESYNVTLATTDFGSTGTPMIRVSVLRDNAGKFYTASWHAEYVNFQESQATPFNICDLDPALTKDNGDGTYSLSTSSDPKRCATAFGVGSTYVVKFTNFQLANHTGSVTIGTTSYTYTATKN